MVKKITILICALAVFSLLLCPILMAASGENADGDKQTFTGSVVSVATGGDKGEVIISSAEGITKTFIITPTVTIMDAFLNVVTLGQISSGDKVAVEYDKDGKGTEKVKTISVTE